MKLIAVRYFAIEWLLHQVFKWLCSQEQEGEGQLSGTVHSSLATSDWNLCGTKEFVH